MRSSSRFRLAGPAAASLAALALAVLSIAPPAFAQVCTDSLHIPLHYSTLPLHPCDGDSVSLVISACFPCVDLTDGSSSPRLAVRARMDLRSCILADAPCRPESLVLSLGRFRTGNHRVFVDVTGVVVNLNGTLCTTTQRDSLAFVIDCVPPPPGGELPYVDDIVVGERVACPTTPCYDVACPNEPIPVFVHGTFPSSCYALRRVELVRSTAGLPTLRILMDDLTCIGRCAADSTPWSAQVSLPPLPPGTYRLAVEAVVVVVCRDTFPNDSTVHRATHPFVVRQEPCSPPRDCFTYGWQGDRDGSTCDATVSRGHSDRVTLTVNTSKAMAGLQGDLSLGDPVLRIANLEAVGRAAGMRLQWRTTPEGGARFVLFAERGAPITPYPGLDFPGGWPVLAVTVEYDASVLALSRGIAYLRLENPLASDSAGGQIPLCPYRRLDPTATICIGTRCDLNADGAADVRDLVIMAQCVVRDCSTSVDLDCNRDGQVQLEDVLCCARYVLASDSVDTTGVRPEPGVRVAFGTPRDVAGGIELPLVLRAADRVGGARLSLAYPADDFDVLDVQVAGGSDWLSLHEVRDGKIVIGLISLGNPGETAVDLPITVRLAPRSGQTPSGFVQLMESEFSGRDGVHLTVETGHPAAGLGGVARLTLSAGRPNPFSATTRFAVELAVAGDLDVGVYDLHGRHVKHLFRGSATPGPQDLIWDGRGADGGRLPSGVYFVRATIAGSVVSRRVVLLSVR